MAVTVTVRKGDMLGFLLEGTLTEADCTEVLIPTLKEAIEKRRDVCVLMQVRGSGGWTAGGAREELADAAACRADGLCERRVPRRDADLDVSGVCLHNRHGRQVLPGTEARRSLEMGARA